MYFLLTLTALAVLGALGLKAVSWNDNMWMRKRFAEPSATEKRLQKILAPKADFSMRKRRRRQAEQGRRGV